MSIIGSALRITRETWLDAALCKPGAAETFFPSKGGSTRDAKRICYSCSVRAECLTYALNHNEPFGVWGGLSERERHRINRARRAPRQSHPPTAGPKCGTRNGVKSHARRGERACDTCLHAARIGAA